MSIRTAQRCMKDRMGEKRSRGINALWALRKGCAAIALNYDDAQHVLVRLLAHTRLMLVGNRCKEKRALDTTYRDIIYNNEMLKERNIGESERECECIRRSMSGYK